MEALKINKEILCQHVPRCKFCGYAKPGVHSRISEIVYDLKLFRGGIKRWIVKYKGNYYLCSKCKNTFVSDSYAMETAWKYGRTLRAYITYQIIARNQSMRDIAENLQELFDYYLQEGSIKRIKENMSIHYASTYRQISGKLRAGELTHVDETKFATKAGVGYVWTFANMVEVLYVYTDTREGEILDGFLDGFSGVLVSDFYSAYDSVECAQQKCHVHLIRDINDALQKNPFDEELKLLAEEYTKLLCPIIETIDRYGLKKYHLNKHKPSIKFLCPGWSKQLCIYSRSHPIHH